VDLLEPYRLIPTRPAHLELAGEIEISIRAGIGATVADLEEQVVAGTVGRKSGVPLEHLPRGGRVGVGLVHARLSEHPPQQ